MSNKWIYFTFEGDHHSTDIINTGLSQDQIQPILLGNVRITKDISAVGESCLEVNWTNQACRYCHSVRLLQIPNFLLENTWTFNIRVNVVAARSWSRFVTFSNNHDMMGLCGTSGGNPGPRFVLLSPGMSSLLDPYSYNTWYWFRVTKNGEIAKYYIDNELVATNNNWSSLVTSDLLDLNIGYGGPNFDNYVFQGYIDDFWISFGYYEPQDEPRDEPPQLLGSNYLCYAGRDRIRIKGVSLGKRYREEKPMNTSFLIERYNRFRTIGVSLEDATPNLFPEKLLSVDIPPSLNIPNTIIPTFESLDVDVVIIEPVLKDIDLEIPSSLIFPDIDFEKDIYTPEPQFTEIDLNIPYLLPEIEHPEQIYVAEDPVDLDSINLDIITTNTIPDIDLDAGPEYQVFYHGNGNTGGSVPIDNKWYRYDAVVTLLYNSGNLIRTGYTWLCWNTKMDGTGIDYNPIDIFNIHTMTTIYAKWIEN